MAAELTPSRAPIRLRHTAALHSTTIGYGSEERARISSARACNSVRLEFLADHTVDRVWAAASDCDCKQDNAEKKDKLESDLGHRKTLAHIDDEERNGHFNGQRGRE